MRDLYLLPGFEVPAADDEIGCFHNWKYLVGVFARELKSRHSIFANQYQLRHDTRTAYKQLNEIMDRSLRRGQRRGVLQESIITQRNGRLVLLIKTECKSQVPGIVHDVSDSGATVFIEPMGAIELGNRWREALLS